MSPPLPRSAALLVRDTGRTGLGVFARVPIAAGAVALVAEGEERAWRSETQADAEANPDWIGLGRDRWLAPEGFARFLNHSCAPNLHFRGPRAFVARRDIGAGEELTFDYALTEDEPLWRMRCACGAARCRGEVRAVQSLSPAEFAAAEPYLLTHFRSAWEAARQAR